MQVGFMGVGNGAWPGVGPAYWALVAGTWIDAAIRQGMPAAQTPLDDLVGA